jgi:hypothetical protein
MLPTPCSPHVKHTDAQTEISKAKAESNFARAEELSRAALAQYVIWVKQHTVPTMNVAPDLYRQPIDIDVLALEAQVALLRDSLEANGNSEVFVTQVRYLASIIGVPRLSMRLTALASQWLSSSGRAEEAILEIDTLGDLEDVDDALALVTAADLLDLPAGRQEQILQRACTVAA